MTPFALGWLGLALVTVAALWRAVRGSWWPLVALGASRLAWGATMALAPAAS